MVWGPSIIKPIFENEQLRVERSFLALLIIDKENVILLLDTAIIHTSNARFTLAINTVSKFMPEGTYK